MKVRIEHKVKQGDWGYGATVITTVEYPVKKSSKEVQLAELIKFFDDSLWEEKHEQVYQG